MKLVHLVFFKFNESDNILKEKLIDELRNNLLALKISIKELKKLEVGKNVSSRAVAFDLALNSEFDQPEDLEIYHVHPEHQKVMEWIKHNNVEVKIVDYLI